MEARELNAADLAQAPQVRLAVVGVNDLPRVWEQLAPLVDRMCAYSAGEFTTETVLAGLGVFDGEARLQMLAIVKGDEVTSAMVTAVSMYPTEAGWVRKLDCLLVSGSDVAEWMPFEPKMDEWARTMGCVSVRIPRARKGWTRTLSPAWERKSGDVCVMEREL